MAIKRLFILLLINFLLFTVKALPVSAQEVKPNHWQLQYASRVGESGAKISTSAYSPSNWYPATVPGTVLTTLVNNKVYPEPLFGENNRPDKISDSLCRQSYWYRSVIHLPLSYRGRRIWLNFDGINYAAQIWVNGHQAGSMRGAFIRGRFDITENVTPGKPAVIAVLVSPQPHPGIPHEHTIANGMGPNGGITAIDGPTFLCSIGWDWIPAIRDRNTGLWQKVYLSSTGPAVIRDPLVTTHLNLPDTTRADLHIATTVTNVTGKAVNGILKGQIGDITFSKVVSLGPRRSGTFSFDPRSYPGLRLVNPRLWWPNGYGAPNLYHLKLTFTVNGVTSSSQDVTFGIREITYKVSDSENLTVSVNGVRVMCKGGNWGMDEAMKRIPRERLEAQIRMHKLANYTMIRNWVGQSTSEDFYEMCDKYGIMLWDEFFQPNPSDGPNPTDLPTYIANVRDKILRFRNHPSIAIWCARNEGYPPREIDLELQKLMKELEPVRLYQPSSTEGRGVNSGGPYYWRNPKDYYVFKEAFKTEIGSVSIPTLESVKGMMPEKDWGEINDDWAEHDLAKGAQRGDQYPTELAHRYGKLLNLADFVRKGQLANYEAYRAIYEGRNAKLFRPCTGVITWMSNPAQPSFVWQIYHHDLEANSSLFGARKGCEPIHIQFNENEEIIQLINNLARPLRDCQVLVSLYNLDGARVFHKSISVASASASAATDLGTIDWPSTLSSVHFIKLELQDKDHKLLSDNFYWHAISSHPDDLTDLDQLGTVKLQAKITRHDARGKCMLKVTLHNSAQQVALMTHLQLRRKGSNTRVLPTYYSDNYVSLVPGETREIWIEASLKDLHDEIPLVMTDGWNIDAAPFVSATAQLESNSDALVSRHPQTGLPIITTSKN